jgi:hypothetical protein
VHFVNNYGASSSAITAYNSYFSDVLIAYKRLFNISLTHHSYWYPTSYPATGTSPNLAIVDNALYIDATVSKGTADITVFLFGFGPASGTQGAAIIHNPPPANDGLAGSWLATVGAPMSWTVTYIKRIAQHEIAHLYGTQDYSASSGHSVDCLSRYENNRMTDSNFNRIDIWCDSCKSVIAQNQGLH